MALKIKRITENSDLNKILEEPGWKPVPAARVRELEAAIRAAAVKRRGGARPGAGRKALDHVPVTISIERRTKKILTEMAHGSRGIGAAVDALVKAIHSLKEFEMSMAQAHSPAKARK